MTDGVLVPTSLGSAAEFARVTGSRWSAGDAGVPLLFGVVPLRLPLAHCLAAALPGDLPVTAPVLHGEHRVAWHGDWSPGQDVVVQASHGGTVPGARGTLVSVRCRLSTPDGDLLETHLMTALVAGVALAGVLGEEVAPLPLGTGPELLRVGTRPGDSRAYAAVSGDGTAFHVDDVAARAAGFPGVILHGLCTLAVAGNALLSHGWPRPSWLGVRFSAPALPGEQLAVHAWAAGDAHGFGVHDADGTPVLARGLWRTGRAPA